MENKQIDRRHQNTVDKSSSTTDRGLKKSMTSSQDQNAHSFSGSKTYGSPKEFRSPLTENNSSKSQSRSHDEDSNKERIDKNPMAGENYTKREDSQRQFDKNHSNQGQLTKDGKPVENWNKKSDTISKDQFDQKPNWNNKAENIEEPDASIFKDESKNHFESRNKQNKSQATNEWKSETEGL